MKKVCFFAIWVKQSSFCCPSRISAVMRRRKGVLSMKRMTAGDLQALRLLMRTTLTLIVLTAAWITFALQCRNCRFHRDRCKYPICVFAKYPLPSFQPSQNKVAHLMPERNLSWITAKSKSSRMNSLVVRTIEGKSSILRQMLQRALRPPTRTGRSATIADL